MARRENTEWVLQLIDQVSGPMRKVQQVTTGASNETAEMNEELREMPGIFDQIKAAGVAAMTAVGIFELGGAIDEVNTLKNHVLQFGDIPDEVASKVTKKSLGLAAMFDQDAKEIANASNAITKQMGGDIVKNFAIMEEGLRKGGNINGDFIEQMTEYPAQFKKAGLDLTQSVALITQANQQGVFSDKGADSVKEMTLAVSEMTQTQQDALAGIGLDYQELMGHMESGAATPFEIMQKIVQNMDGKGIAAKQAVIADVFKGAGEDMGDKFLSFLGTADLSLANIEDRTTGYAQMMYEMNQVMTDVKVTVAEKLTPIITGIYDFVMDNKEIFIVLAAGLTAYAIGVAAAAAPTIAATVATWGLNSALLANPVVLVVAGIAMLVAALVLAYKKSETFRKIIDGITKGFWILVDIVKTKVLLAFTQFMGFIESIKPKFWELLDVLLEWGKKLYEFILKYHPLALLIRFMTFLFPNLKTYLANIIAWVYDKFINPLFETWNKVKEFFGFGEKTEVEFTANNNTEDPQAGNEKVIDPNKDLGIKDDFKKPTKPKGKTTKSGAIVGSMKINQELNFNISIDGSKIQDKRRMAEEVIGIVTKAVADGTLIATS